MRKQTAFCFQPDKTDKIARPGEIFLLARQTRAKPMGRRTVDGFLH
jgi:hypothetical protein